jgi:hypothetical protein
MSHRSHYCLISDKATPTQLLQSKDRVLDFAPAHWIHLFYPITQLFNTSTSASTWYDNRGIIVTIEDVETRATSDSICQSTVNLLITPVANHLYAVVALSSHLRPGLMRALDACRATLLVLLPRSGNWHLSFRIDTSPDTQPSQHALAEPRTVAFPRRDQDRYLPLQVLRHVREIRNKERLFARRAEKPLELSFQTNATGTTRSKRIEAEVMASIGEKPRRLCR